MFALHEVVDMRRFCRNGGATVQTSKSVALQDGQAFFRRRCDTLHNELGPRPLAPLRCRAIDFALDVEFDNLYLDVRNRIPAAQTLENIKLALHIGANAGRIRNRLAVENLAAASPMATMITPIASGVADGSAGLQLVANPFTAGGKKSVESKVIWPRPVSISLAVFARSPFSTGRMDGS